MGILPDPVLITTRNDLLHSGTVHDPSYNIPIGVVAPSSAKATGG
jgi:hypothetical protein